MKKFLLILSLLFPLFSFCEEEGLSPLNLQAEALTEAHDYKTAIQILETLLKRDLPDWQKERLLYNIGTIHLNQKHLIEALQVLQKINPTALSLPLFGRHLFVNEGIAYLQYAQSLALDPSTLDQHIIFTEQALKAFDQARQFECQEQKEESTTLFCEPSLLLNQWIGIARLQLKEAFKNKQQKWLENGSIETLASFLHVNIEKWMNHLKKSKKEMTPAILAYYQHQGESFLLIWNELQQKKISPNQKIALEKSLIAYQSALQSLNQQELLAAIKQAENTLEIIYPLAFQPNQKLHLAKLNYERLLLQQTVPPSSLKELIKQFESLTVKKEEKLIVEQVKTSLKKSLEGNQSKQPEQAQFFLIAGYSQFDPLLKEKNSTPMSILQRAIDQANRLLHLYFLAGSSPEPTPSEMHPILKNLQKNMLNQALLFIPTVLKEEDKLYHQTTDKETRCQQIPWNQVIPLYDHGFRLALHTDKQLSISLMNFQSIIGGDIQTIKDWQQALNLILHPPQQQESSSTSQKWTETYRQIQEMYLEDQSEPEQTTKELHSW